ncbi:hypothetical protein CO044_01745 [Candidatus Peregrinibacteria bacterium CG_4_9_14_0_2_um_filter_38_9]|nr:MAG: hypothetical protein CO044_01745 [Candidatus Peregrinibacteria bacterium CG_4_9_14_0_2_um_filter_38_9]
MKKFFALSMLTALVLVGCSKAEAPVASVPVVDANIIANAPVGCPQQTTLNAQSKEAGDVTFPSKNSWFIDGGADKGYFHFANYDRFDPANTFADISGTDVHVYFDLSTKDKAPLAVGTWNYRKDAENNQLSWLNISTEKLSGGVFDDNGKVELTYVGTDYVCGKVTAKDSSSSLNGEFIAKYVKPNY